MSQPINGISMNFRKFLLAALVALSSFGAFAAVDANTAAPAELQGVKGLGPAMSAKIVAARETGPFKDWDDLQARVKGIGPANSAKLSTEGLTVGGAAFGAPVALPEPAPAPAAIPAVKATKPKAAASAARK
jgi:competence protein ComEA